MARKTFISYKYSEARYLRDEIIKAFGNDATYYTGETSKSPSFTDETTEYIKEKLKDMIYNTSVTIVILSPNIKDSNWIDWEIEYSLKQIKRGDRTSGTNGILGVVMKYNGDYSWLRPNNRQSDGCETIGTNTQFLFDIINNNRFNQRDKVYSCNTCKCVSQLEGSYFSIVEEEEFLKNPSYYIDNAFDKSEKSSEYNIVRKK